MQQLYDYFYAKWIQDHGRSMYLYRNGNSFNNTMYSHAACNDPDYGGCGTGATSGDEFPMDIVAINLFDNLILEMSYQGTGSGPPLDKSGWTPTQDLECSDARGVNGSAQTDSSPIPQIQIHIED